VVPRRGALNVARVQRRKLVQLYSVAALSSKLELVVKNERQLSEFRLGKLSLLEELMCSSAPIKDR